jgi:hypothetical protein
VTIDTTPPPVPELLAPADGLAVNTGTPQLHWSAVTDAVGYLLKWDGSEAIDVGDVTSYDMAASDGLHTWTVAAYDHVDNTSDYADPWSLTIDTTPPAVPVLQDPAPGAILTSTAVVLRWHTAADAVGYLLRWDGGTVDVGDVLSHTVSATDGTHTWTVAAYDHVDNRSDDAGVRSLRVDTMPPTVEATVPGDGATGVAPTAPLVITFSEPVDPDSLQMSASPDPGGWFAAWAPGNQAVTLSHAPFEVETTYVVTVLTVDDVAGLAMAGSYSWTFDTGKYLLYMPIVLRGY